MHLFLKEPNLLQCEKCGQPMRSHTVCPACGFYKGTEVVNVLAKLDRRQRRLKEAEMAAKAESQSEPQKDGAPVAK